MKKIIFVLLLAITLTALSACGQSPASPTISGNQQNTQVPQNSAPEQTVSEPPIEGSHLAKTLCDGLEIDADIPVSASSTLPTYQAKPFNISSDTAVSLLVDAANREIAENQKDSDDPNGYKITFQNGAILYHQCGRLIYWSDTMEKDLEIFDLLTRYGQKHDDETPHALTFMSPQDAIKHGEELIGALGLMGIPVVQTIVGLSSAEITAWQTELLKDENYKSWVDAGKTLILNDLTDEDDAYFISFSFTYKNIPVFNQDIEPGVKSASNSFPPMSMKADLLVTAKGLRYFTLQNAAGANGNASEEQSVITAEQALEKLVTKYENTILFGTQYITEIWLEYIPIADPNSHNIDAPLTLKPYWCFGLTGEERQYGIESAERFNAITGDDLAYGG